MDSTLFLLHAFTHGCGATREARMTEGMLMMGCPVANGMLSTLLAVFFLVGTTKFVLIAFFRMMVLVCPFEHTARTLNRRMWYCRGEQNAT